MMSSSEDEQSPRTNSPDDMYDGSSPVSPVSFGSVHHAAGESPPAPRATTPRTTSTSTGPRTGTPTTPQLESLGTEGLAASKIAKAAAKALLQESQEQADETIGEIWEIESQEDYDRLAAPGKWSHAMKYTKESVFLSDRINFRHALLAMEVSNRTSLCGGVIEEKVQGTSRSADSGEATHLYRRDA